MIADRGQYALRLVCLLMVGVFVTISACQRKVPPPVQKIGLDPDSIYSMYTRDVNALVSDSGITQYRLVARDWYIYNADQEHGREAHWSFPHGFYAEQFDEQDSAIVFIEADSAFYWTDRKLWELRGDVEILNRTGSRFESPRMFWDQKERLIYSPDSVFIDTPERKLRGKNFTSDEQFTKYTFLGSSGSAMVHDEEL